MKSFEIQIYRSGTWKTDSIYDDRALAEMEARRMDDSPRYGNLRIIEEVWDENTETTTYRTVFRDKAFQEKIAGKTEAARLKKNSVQNNEKREGEYKTKRQPKSKPNTKISKIIINLGLIGLVGIAGMIALQYLSTME